MCTYIGKHKKIEILLLVMFFLIGCRNQEGSANYLFENPCQLPCWYDVKPGTTQEHEALEILQMLEFIDYSTLDKRGNPYGLNELAPVNDNFYQVVSFNFMDRSIGRLNIRNQIVYRIDIQSLRRQTLGYFLDYLGDPDSIYVMQVESSGFSCYEGWLLYERSETFIVTDVCSESGTPYEIYNDRGRFSPEMLVSQVSFFSLETSLAESLEEALHPNHELAQDIALDSEAWDGFGFYKIHQP